MLEHLEIMSHKSSFIGGLRCVLSGINKDEDDIDHPHLQFTFLLEHYIREPISQRLL